MPTVKRLHNNIARYLPT